VTEGEKNILIYYMGDIEKMSSDQYYDYVITQPTDCLTIIYTSGSSDFPKGVMISDRAYKSIFEADPSPFTGEFITISYQPLAWYGGRNTLIATLLCGGRTGFSTGNISRLMEEMALIRPTVFAAPPSIWNHVYSEFKTALSLTATGDPEQNAQVEENLLRQFSKLIPARCNAIAVVGALISPVVLNFLQRCFRHCCITDAYGITECGGVAFNNHLDSNVVYRLESVPEMGFTIDDKPFPRGELLTKTAQMFSGYVNNLTETRAALTDDGFFRTGDIVELRPVPNEPPEIRIIDRKKNFFKLSHGQFASPEYLQNIFAQSSFIEQIYIHGDPYEDCITAVVVPNKERVQIFSIENSGKSCEPDPKLYNAIMYELHSIGTKASLQKHEIPSRIIIDFEPFTVENGLLTSSMKPCRPKLAAHYGNRLKTTNSIEKRLKAIIETVTGQPLATNDTNGFLAAGGNSLTALRLSRLIQEDLGTTIPISVLFEPEMNLKHLTAFAQDPSLIQNDSFISRLFHDAELELNITIGKPRDFRHTPLTVFVTGTTGFVGGFLLFELLTKYPNDSKFVCLVRCEHLVDPLDRIRKNLIFLRLWQDNFRERIVAVRGDLSQTQFGLDNDMYVTLTAQIDIIFHCGATVNFVLPYSQLYDSNVCGTREIIRFATYAPTCIPVQYISTISVLPPDIADEVHIDEITPHYLTTGYGQSKWVAEKLMAKANRLGLPVVIYRLGSMCCDSKTGACNPFDFNTILFTTILKIRCYPVELVNTKLDTLPINFAVESIVYLSQFRPDVYGHVYHIIHPDGGMIFQNIITSAISCEIKLESVFFEQWRTRLTQEMTKCLPFESMDEFLIDNVCVKRSILSSKQFYSVVSQLSVPVMDHDYAKKWLIFILQNIIK
jgi:fatty acid CoA ligase FadD9